MIHAPFSEETQVTIERKTKFRIGDSIYKPTKKIVLDYLDWRGSNAGIYMSHPLQKKQTVRFGPCLEETDIPEDAHNLIASLAIRYHKLLNQDELDATEKRERDQLGELLTAA